MLIEGEEESGSVGFKEILENCKEDVGRVDCILVSNSYWLGEETPCLTNGLRGVVRATVKVIGQDADVHSGVEGGGLREPMIDVSTPRSRSQSFHSISESNLFSI